MLFSVSERIYLQSFIYVFQYYVYISLHIFVNWHQFQIFTRV